jgi:exodeoxyribonuclease V alpha subunit
MEVAFEEAPREIHGTIERLFFSDERFTAGILRSEDGARVPFAGSLVVRQGDAVILRGAWIEHPRYGRQFQVAHFEFHLPLDPEGLARFLANHPDVAGIGPVKAKLIAQVGGADFERILEEEPERLARAAHVSIETIEALRATWMKTRSLNAALTWLSGFGLSYFEVKTLTERLGNNAVSILRDDPYVLVREIGGFGFRRVDLIARKLGTPKESPSRIRAGIVYCVEERLDAGDCWVEYEDLIERANLLLAMDVCDSRARIEGCLDELVAEGALVCKSVGGRFVIATPEIHRMESDLARWLSQSAERNPHFEDEDLEALLETIAASLNEPQRRAARLALRYRQVLVSGGAGTGKTYWIAALTRLYRSRDLGVVLCAPTGKAAKRLEEVVGHEASTIHRLLGFDGREYRRGPENPIEADVVLVDELSMVDVPLAWRLYRAIAPETSLVFVGDHNQLPPVGPGHLLRDLIDRRLLPHVILDEVVRQAGVLKENCQAILRGEVRPTEPVRAGGGRESAPRRAWYVLNALSDAGDVVRAVEEIYERVLEETLGFDLVGDVQLLTPTHKGPLGTAELNLLLQRIVQKKRFGRPVAAPAPGRRPAFLPGDKVIQNRNAYELGLMNGAVGVVLSVGSHPGELVVRFEDEEIHITAASRGARDLSLAYALSVHKAQGSEFPCVIVIVHKHHSFMLDRNLLYTAATRARKVAIFLGDAWGMRQCAKTRRVDQRKTFLGVLDLPAAATGEVLA